MVGVFQVSREKLIAAVFSLVSALAISAFGWVWSTHSQMLLMQAQLDQLRSDHRTDAEQDRQIKVLFRYAEWLDENASYLRFGGPEPARRPKWDSQ